MKKLLLFSICIVMMLITKVHAQSRSIKGTVKDVENGLPLPGVNVKVKGSAIGATTDQAGNFALPNVPDNSVIIFSFLSYSTQEITLGNSSNLQISLASNSTQLGEVVVNGYGSQSRSQVTGSVAQVKSSDVENRSYTSIDQTLQGRVAGLQSSGSSGQPGAMQQIRIRGIGSIGAGSNPLYVIDGVIINSGDLSRNTNTANTLSGLNANDIESINVLKDASATAIYGSRAANGVIVITTKQGKAGKTKVSFDAEYGISKPGETPDAGKLLNTDQWRQLTAQGLLNNPTYVKNYGLTKDNVIAYVDKNLGTGNGVNTDWLDLVQRTGRQQQYNLGLSGGTEKTQFSVTGGYFKQRGTVIASEFERYSTALNLTTKVNDRLTFATSLIIGYTGQRTPSNAGSYDAPITAAVSLVPFLSPFNADGSYNIDPSSWPSSNNNPLYIAKYNKNSLHQLKSIGKVSAEYKILDNLKFTSRLGADFNNLEEDSYSNPVYGGAALNNGSASRYYTRYFNWIFTNLLDYRLDLNKDNTWVANIKAGYEAQKSQYYFSSVTSNGFPTNPDITVPSNGSIPRTAAGSNEDYTIASLLSLADISYKGKYVLSGSFRRDGSSRFGANNRYGNFWSVGASWNVSEESFIKDQTWINSLKLRTSYGLTGNADIGNYNWRQLYSYGYSYNGMGGSAPTSVGNNNLTWETNKQADIGLDLAVFNNRLSFTADYYNRDATNLLLDQPTSLTTGFTYFTNNVGSLRNRGLELSVSGTPVIAGDFSWQASFNIAKNKNSIESLVGGKDIISGSFIRRVGMDFQTFYLRQWAGVNPANGSPLWYTDASKTETTSNYNEATPVAAYSASPKVFGSFSSTFTYKGFSLDGMLYYNFGNYIQDRWSRYNQGDGLNTAYNRYVSQLNAWTPENTNTNTPIYIYANANNSARESSRFLYKGDYVRLREVTLGYTFPKEWLNTAKIERLKVYLRANNLVTWVRDKNLPYDPQVGLTSVANYDIAAPRIYTIGINAGF